MKSLDMFIEETVYDLEFGDGFRHYPKSENSLKKTLIIEL